MYFFHNTIAFCFFVVVVVVVVVVVSLQISHWGCIKMVRWI